MDIKDSIIQIGQILNYVVRGFAGVIAVGAIGQLARVAIGYQLSTSSAQFLEEEKFAIGINLVSLPLAYGISKIGQNILAKAHQLANQF